MQSFGTASVTQLLLRWRAGDEASLDQLTPIVYDQLRVLARRYMRAEKAGHTLRTTALVNEAFLRLVDSNVSFNDRAHFLAVSARLMRRILVDHAREFASTKRGGRAERVTLEESSVVSYEKVEDMLDLNEALEKLAQFDPRKSQLVELIFFGGLTYEEAGEVVNMSVAGIHRQLKLTKAWLRSEMEGERKQNR